MRPDDLDLDGLVCQCFQVTLRKVLAFLRVHKPQRASRISDCLRAGTGCGGCRPELQRLFRQFQDEQCQPKARGGQKSL